MARERRKFQVGRSENRKLHRGHFAFMRALVEGLDEKGVVSRNRRNFRYPSSNPATSASRSMILPLLWKV